MNRNKWIVLAVGIVLLTGLSAVALNLENASGPEPGMGGNGALDDSQNEQNTTAANNENTVSENGGTMDGDLNISASGDEQHVFDNPERETELRQSAEELLTADTLPEAEERPTEASLMAHSRLYYLFLERTNEGYSAESIDQDAEWTAGELYTWLEYAESEFAFDFDTESYSAFIHEGTDLEEAGEDEDQSLMMLFEVIEEAYGSTMLQRQQDIHYLEPFIRSQITEEVIARYGEHDEDEEGAFMMIQETIFERMSQRYPELVDQ